MGGSDPRVTLAALAHPGLNSVVAPRLVDAYINDESLRRNFTYTLWRNPTTCCSGARDRLILKMVPAM